jgi:hypothetical protein
MNGQPDPASFRRQLAAAFLVPFLVLLAFSGKAFHIDDPIFLWIARQILASPWDFYGFDLIWRTERQPMHVESQNPPGMGYLLALAGPLAGWREVPLHLLTAILASIGSVGLFLLARRFCANAVLATFIAVLSPAYLACANTLMSDAPMLAAYIWAVYFWLEGLDKKRHGLLFASAALITIGVFIKYYALSAVPLLAYYTLAKERRIGAWAWHFLLPLAAVALYQWWTWRLYGRTHIGFAAAHSTNATAFATLTAPAKRALTALLFTGGSCITALFFAPLTWRRYALAGLALAAGLLVAYLSTLDRIAYYPAPDERPIDWTFLLHVGLFALAGAHVLALGAVDAWRRRDPDGLLLFLWLIGGFVFTAFVNHLVNVRTVLFMVPAAGILVVRQLERRDLRLPAWAPYLALVPGALLALWITTADYRLANALREAAHRVVQSLPEHSGNVHFAGHWGWQYYLEDAGLGPLTAYQSEDRWLRLDLQAGDLLIVPSAGSTLAALALTESTRLDAFTVPLSAGVAIQDHYLGAGFHSHQWGPLPYRFAPVPPLEVRVYRIELDQPRTRIY